MKNNFPMPEDDNHELHIEALLKYPPEMIGIIDPPSAAEMEAVIAHCQELRRLREQREALQRRAHRSKIAMRACGLVFSALIGFLLAKWIYAP